MSWEDEMRANMYARNAFKANSDAEFNRLNQSSDQAVDFVKGIGNAIGDMLSSKPAPPPPPPPSGGNVAGKLLAGAALAGGAFLLSKLFGSDDTNGSNKVNSKTSKA